MATAAQPVVPDQSALSQVAQRGASSDIARSNDPTPDAPQQQTGDEMAAARALDKKCQDALIEIRKIFKMRYQPKRLRYVQEIMRSFEAIRGNTFALLNDQSAALDTINQMMQGFLGAGDDPELYKHNDNIYQPFCMIFIAALMVDLGKTRYQPADAQDEEDLQIAKKASTIHAYNERKNDIRSLQQIELLYLWLCGCYFCYVRYVIDKANGTTRKPVFGMQSTKIVPDGYMCPNCGADVPDTKASLFTDDPSCPQCGSTLSQKDWHEGPELDLPVQLDELEVANGMTKFGICNALMIDCNPDAMELAETEILDYTIDTSVGKVRLAYPKEYPAITAALGSDGSMDGDIARTARQGQTTPGSNQRAITTEGLVSYSRTWITPVAFYELDDQTVADELLKRYPEGCKLVLCGADKFLDAQPEALLKRWTWCGTVKGLGLYPFAAGKVVLDVQERITAAVNKIDAHMDRSAFGMGFYDADYIDGDALTNKLATPGNLTPVARTDEETGQKTPLADLFYHATFTPDQEIYRYPDTLTTRAQFLAGVMPQVFGGSDKNIQTAEGQEQALNTALGRLKQYIDQMRAEKAKRAELSVRCSIDNMDEEIRIVEPGETKDSWQTIQMLRAELTGDFFTYPETDEGFPATYAEIQSRVMQLLAENQKMPYVANLLKDPDVAAAVAHYILPDQIELPDEAQRAKIKTVLHRLAQDPSGAVPKPNPANPQGPPIVIPSILPEPNVDDPTMCSTLAKKWLLKNWEQLETNPTGYNNVLAYFTISSQMSKQEQAEALLTQAAQAQHGQKSGAGQGAPGQPGS